MPADDEEPSPEELAEHYESLTPEGRLAFMAKVLEMGDRSRFCIQMNHDALSDEVALMRQRVSDRDELADMVIRGARERQHMAEAIGRTVDESETLRAHIRELHDRIDALKVQLAAWEDA